MNKRAACLESWNQAQRRATPGTGLVLTVASEVGRLLAEHGTTRRAIAMAERHMHTRVGEAYWRAVVDALWEVLTDEANQQMGGAA